MKKKRSVVAVITASEDGKLDQQCKNIVTVSRRGDYFDSGLPGGKVEEGETDFEAIVREIQEETGLVLKKELSVAPFDRRDCGDYDVSIFKFDLVDFVNTTDLLYILSRSFISSEDCRVVIQNIDETFTNANSFSEFNRQTYYKCKALGYMHWEAFEDVNIDLVADFLRCTVLDIGDAIEHFSCDSFTLSSYEENQVADDLREIDAVTCDECGVWEDLFFTEQLGGMDLCTQCAAELEEEE